MKSHRGETVKGTGRHLREKAYLLSFRWEDGYHSSVRYIWSYCTAKRRLAQHEGWKVRGQTANPVLSVASDRDVCN